MQVIVEKNGSFILLKTDVSEKQFRLFMKHFIKCLHHVFIRNFIKNSRLTLVHKVHLFPKLYVVSEITTRYLENFFTIFTLI